MANVYENDDSGGYTKEANKLQMETTQAVEQIVAAALGSGMTPEAVEYVMCHAVWQEILKQRIMARRKGRGKTNGSDDQV